MDQDALHAHFAQFVATLGRGPGRSRALTRDEAREAFGLVLQGAPHPIQVGAFLMLLRYRGEDPSEIAGLVEAARADGGLGRTALERASGRARLPPVDLDWPSYGAGRTRQAPWFLLSALALADSGIRVLMHGSNEFSGGISVPDALSALGRAVQSDAAEVSESLDRTGFAYWPVWDMAPRLHDLLGLRRLFGLRSPVNTVARLLDPADAAACVNGVFHPPYIAVHLGVADILRRRSVLVLKGGGGEAERSPGKPITVHVRREGEAVRELVLPALSPAGFPPRGSDGAAMAPSLIRAVWRGEAREAIDPGALRFITDTITGTIAMALLAMARCETIDVAERQGVAIWHARQL